MKKQALISVSDKRGIEDFAVGLIRQGYEIISTGGTYELLKQHGAMNISDVTNFPEMLDGRVKTLHPTIHGGILAMRDNPSHMETLAAHSIGTIDIVVVNLYPFKATIQKPGVTYEEAVENIDIGGPAMIRSAAKNHAHVAVVVDPEDYSKILNELSAGGISKDTKQALMAKAFRHTAAYDALIASYFTKEIYPEKLTITYEKTQTLRYGENPHQQAALYGDPLPTSSIVTAKQLHGKELSYINIGDADAALALVREFDTPAVVAVKHYCPCGVGIGDTVAQAYDRAYEADPVSIFGGIVAFNREVDEYCATQMNEIFLEIIIAPSYTEGALKILTKKKNLRLLQLDVAANSENNQGQHIVSINGGLLAQEKDRYGYDNTNLTFPTKKKPTEDELRTAKFAWTVIKYVKSNGILIAKDNMTIGIGPGQTNRVGAAKIAISGAGERAKGAVLASDAMFPMPDTVEEAAKAGISVIIQTGGSLRDQDSIDACDKHGIAMILTGVRHFRH
ncbi:MAG: bifunctional phosphoribosylaminoimidazolecarboxamide formyltransferase/IMP cyclohydrolase [Defluviitaleaceae bacterium]|nr:bifunctional phosphoribosylaminoimidazolecarboxamide formyltransferase/IMP cyclohydrolase [Defluviitaleaceae bacterium]